MLNTSSCFSTDCLICTKSPCTSSFGGGGRKSEASERRVPGIAFPEELNEEDGNGEEGTGVENIERGEG